MNSSKNKKTGININVDKIILAAKKIHSISHHTRVKIISMLSETDSMNVGEITQRLNMGQPETSGHLILLKNLGILKKKRSGKMSLYSINYDMVNEIIRISNDLT